MKKILFALVLTLCSFAASAQIAYPGSNWSVLTYHPGVIKNTPEDNNVLLQGSLEQGIVWGHIGDWRVNTYGSLGYSYDRNGLSYNNKLVPAIGVKLQHSFADNGNLDIGVQLVHEDHFRGRTDGPRSGNGIQVYASYWFGWDLKR